MKKALNVILLFVCSIFLTTIWEPFSLYATGDSFDAANYQLVDYVYPKNNASGIYINTGYAPNQNTTIIATMSNSGSNTGFYYGVTKTVNGSARSVGFKNGSSNYQIRTMNNNTNVNVTGSKFSDNTVFVVNQSPTVTTITSGNTTYTSSTYSYGNYTLNSLYIFGLNNNGLQTGNTYARLYDMEIYESSVLVHHYYPCYRKSDDVVGIFDGVSNVFITSSGGDLAYGSAVSDNYTITTAVSPSGSGTVSGGGTYASGTTITLTATAYSGYVFSSWSDNDTSNPRSVTVTADTTYTAIFEQESTPTPSYTVSLSVSPTGSGTVSGSGSYSSGTSVTISATAGTGYEFVKWSDDSTSNPRTLVVSANVSLTAIFQEQSSNPDPEPDVPSSWTNWTDEDDQEYLEDITSSIDLSKIYWSSSWKREFVDFQLYSTRLNFGSGYSGDYSVSFVGSYYDNTITGITACNSTSYQSSTSVTAPHEQITVHPFVIGELNAGPFGYLQFGVDVEDVTSSQGSVTTSYQSNSTEACRLVGVYNDDSSLGVLQYLDYGYEIKTYNDGNGNTATVFVPGEEAIEFEADLEFFDDLLEGLYATIVNNLQIIYKDVYTMQLHGKDGYLLPEYGSVYSEAFLGTMMEWQGMYIGEGEDWPFSLIDKHFTAIPQDNTYAKFMPFFSRAVDSTTNKFKNYTNLYWQGTRNPVWKFETNLQQEFIQNVVYTHFGVNYTGRIDDNYGFPLSSSYGDALTISSEDATEHNLTQGAVMMLSASSVKFYQYKNNSILNRFNQLGSFLSTWFNRIYQSIGNITGGNESNDIINNVVNDYDISVETDFNGLLQNVNNTREDIDLTLPEFNIPSSDLTGVQSLAQPLSDVFDIYIDNGLGIMVFIPVLLLVLRLIL